jgi:hypothetical protein
MHQHWWYVCCLGSVVALWVIQCMVWNFLSPEKALAEFSWKHCIICSWMILLQRWEMIRLCKRSHD